MKRILFLLSFIFIVQFVFSQAPAIRTSVDKKEILIGDQFKYVVDARFPANSYNISWFNIPDSFSHFEVVRRGKIDTIQNNGTLVCRQILTLTSFDSGINTIPALAIDFEPITNAPTQHLFTDSIPINVSFSPLDSTKTFHDIKTIIEVKDTIPLWLIIGVAIFLAILIILIIYLVKYFRRRKKIQPLFNSKLSPFEEAMQSLDNLQNEQLLYKGEVKKFHTSLTEIFKRYFSRKMDKNMLNLTSSEVLLTLNDTLLSKEDTSQIAGSLRLADAVKFAKFYPHKEESESALITTKKVIEQIDKLIFQPQNSK